MHAGEPESPGADGAADRSPGRAALIADKIDALITREAARAGGRAPTYRELAERINRIAGHDVISKDTIRNLHHGVTQKGQTPNPTVETLDWLGRGFGIRQGAAYFLDDARTAAVDEQLERLEQLGELRQALGNNDVVNLVQRASGLSDGSLHMLLALADRLKSLEEGAADQGGPGAQGER
ncbi:hypothetical protein [Kitasatospora sp. A2-31]|uniref:hypothetical protein n=1 Tax=Kitasatospora sp. A2-31 TaxID=2916414 RepID=UPI001EEF2EB6|nr:hypothetical protein [Kitasatospora sp. A2-31]MCG6499999.1 hypothetical protein [Kitasatospora sp. A2-31]MCG6500021.1 hypothetical protein [Kitasatospora sp. A2-31]